MRNAPLAATLCLSLTLAGCGAQLTAAPAAPDALRPTAVRTVLQPGDVSDAALEAQYGGQLITRTPEFALIGVSAAPGQVQTLALDGSLDANQNVYRTGTLQASGTIGLWGSGTIGLWGSGTIGLWGSGTIGLWGTGTIGLWGSGGYAPLPANTGVWQSIGLDSAQARARKLGAGITVAVLDTGLDLSHPAFAGSLSPKSDWKDFVDGDVTPQDEGTLGTGETGHGTEVAGLVLQLAPAATIMPLRVLDTQGSGDVASVAAAIVWATTHGAQVINLSLGSEAPVGAVSQAIAFANSRGVFVAAAAGNTGQMGLDYPAAEFSKGHLNVAVGSHSASYLKSDFSRYGAALGLLAPGEGLAGPAPASRVATWSGTSMSTGVVSGALALGLGQRPVNDRDATLTLLRQSAQSVDRLSGNTAYAGNLGRGRLDLAAFTRQLP
jgi:Subtilase family